MRYTTEREDAGSAILDMYATLDESLEDKDYGVGTGKNSCEEAWNQALQFCDYYNTIEVLISVQILFGTKYFTRPQNLDDKGYSGY